MVTVQACQKRRLVLVHPNKAKSFTAATIHHRCGKRGTQRQESRNAPRSHASKQKRDDGEVEAYWAGYTQHVARAKARKWVNIWN